jgi:hypothetical protein
MDHTIDCVPFPNLAQQLTNQKEANKKKATVMEIDIKYNYPVDLVL